jgi:hypothetical protein
MMLLDMVLLGMSRAFLAETIATGIDARHSLGQKLGLDKAGFFSVRGPGLAA